LGPLPPLTTHSNLLKSDFATAPEFPDGEKGRA
jgi:hypothetical protein